MHASNRQVTRRTWDDVWIQQVRFKFRLKLVMMQPNPPNWLKLSLGPNLQSARFGGGFFYFPSHIGWLKKEFVLSNSSEVFVFESTSLRFQSISLCNSLIQSRSLRKSSPSINKSSRVFIRRKEGRQKEFLRSLQKFLPSFNHSSWIVLLIYQQRLARSMQIKIRRCWLVHYSL